MLFTLMSLSYSSSNSAIYTWDASQNLNQNLGLFAQNLQKLDSLVQKKSAQKPTEFDLNLLKNQYLKVRQSYKKSESVLLYLYPDAIQKYIPAPFLKLDLVDKTNQTVFSPFGLQRIEQILWQDTLQISEIHYLCLDLLQTNLSFLQRPAVQLTQDRQFEIISLALVRILSQNLGSMDAPFSGATMTDIHTILTELQSLSKDLKTPSLERMLSQSAKTILTAKSFDYGQFLIKNLNPAFREAQNMARQAIARSKSPLPVYVTAIHPNNTGFFDTNFFNRAFFKKSSYSAQPIQAIALGKKLFDDVNLSSTQKIACISCHNPQLGLSDGVAQSQGVNGFAKRNSPTLWNATFQKSFFLDGRARTLTEQFDHVVFNSNEFNTDYLKIIEYLNSQKSYQAEFASVYPSVQQYGINKSVIVSAIAAYIETFVSLNSPFDRWQRGELVAYPKSNQRGFNLFMGKAGCAACHFPPLFNGNSGPYFSDSENENIGTLDQFDTLNPQLSSDLGRGELFQNSIANGYFRTPSLRQLKYTAPYMHKGQFKNLDQVLQFYNKGGAAGMKVSNPNQTLPSAPLNLTQKELADLRGFLESLSE